MNSQITSSEYCEFYENTVRLNGKINLKGWQNETHTYKAFGE
jgi:hypothetical protein